MISADTIKSAGVALSHLALAVARDGTNRGSGLDTELTEEELTLVVAMLHEVNESLKARNYRGPKK